MKITKFMRVLLCLLCLLLALAALPVSAVIVRTGVTPDGISYEIDENSQVTVTGYTGGSSSLTIPSYIEGCPVTKTGLNAFVKNEKLKSVTLPDTLVSIGEGTFNGCKGLTSIVIPQSVKHIDKFAFSLTGLTSVVIPDNVESLGDSAFLDCAQLASVTLGKGIKSIGKMAFLYCVSLESIVIPQGVTRIEKSTFAQCFKLQKIEIPKTVTSIDEYAFSLCRALNKVYFTGSQAQWNKVSIGSNNEPLYSVSISFNSAMGKTLLGDANTDGKVNVKDATEIQKSVAGIVTLSAEGKRVADADGSGAVNVKDATAIQKFVAGINTGFSLGLPA